ncbi:MAG: hypothetical protein JO002_09235 [Burkholderiaceae bacterium]|nr:hypothetical protein [Burkholderiaceae bacterium]
MIEISLFEKSQKEKRISRCRHQNEGELHAFTIEQTTFALADANAMNSLAAKQRTLSYLLAAIWPN